LLFTDDKIPEHATLIYDVELLEIQEGHRPSNFFGEIDADGDNLLSQDEVTAVANNKLMSIELVNIVLSEYLLQTSFPSVL